MVYRYYLVHISSMVWLLYFWCTHFWYGMITLNNNAQIKFDFHHDTLYCYWIMPLENVWNVVAFHSLKFNMIVYSSFEWYRLLWSCSYDIIAESVVSIFCWLSLQCFCVYDIDFILWLLNFLINIVLARCYLLHFIEVELSKVYNKVDFCCLL